MVRFREILSSFLFLLRENNGEILRDFVSSTLPPYQELLNPCIARRYHTSRGRYLRRRFIREGRRGILAAFPFLEFWPEVGYAVGRKGSG